MTENPIKPTTPEEDAEFATNDSGPGPQVPPPEPPPSPKPKL